MNCTTLDYSATMTREPRVSSQGLLGREGQQWLSSCPMAQSHLKLESRFLGLFL